MFSAPGPQAHAEGGLFHTKLQSPKRELTAHAEEKPRKFFTSCSRWHKRNAHGTRDNVEAMLKTGPRRRVDPGSS